MEPVRIVEIENTKNGWRAVVEVGREDVDDNITYNVNLDADTFERITQDADTTPETFIEATFRFLLEREPKESILREFDVDDIVQYYPNFEQQITDLLQ